MITRPDGRPYRPRKPGLRAHAWETGDDQGVIVFGTLAPAEAEAFALAVSAYWYGSGGAVVDPHPGWFRDRFRWGERRWERDEVTGSPGVMFTWVDAMPGAVDDVRNSRQAKEASGELPVALQWRGRPRPRPRPCRDDLRRPSGEGRILPARAGQTLAGGATP